MMNTTQDDGGPAFPIPTLEREYWDREQGEPNGMSLRDWFAGMALQGMMANPECNAMAGQDVARNCYRIAEEMIAARKEAR